MQQFGPNREETWDIGKKAAPRYKQWSLVRRALGACSSFKGPRLPYVHAIHIHGPCAGQQRHVKSVKLVRFAWQSEAQAIPAVTPDTGARSQPVIGYGLRPPIHRILWRLGGITQDEI